MGIDGQVGRCERRCEVWRNDGTRCRDVASGVGQGDLQVLAIKLRRCEHHLEGSIGPHHAAADHIAGRVANVDRGAGFAAARQARAISGDNERHGRIRSGGVGAIDHWSHNTSCGGRVARCILGRDLQRLARCLCRLQGNAEQAVRPSRGRAQQHAVSPSDRHRGTGLGAACERCTLSVDGKFGRRQRSGRIRRGHGARCRHIAGCIGQGYLQVFVVDLGGVERYIEAAIGPDRTGTEQVASGITNVHDRTRFTAPRQAQAIRGNQQVDGGCRCRGVRYCTATAAAAATAAQRRRAAAHAEQSQACDGPRRHRVARRTDACNQFVQRSHFVEGEAGESLSVVFGLPEGAVFADEHHVAADACLVHREEITDGDLFAGLERDDQILPALRDGGDLVGRDGHLHDAWAIESDIAPGILGGDGGLLIGDDDVFHEVLPAGRLIPPGLNAAGIAAPGPLERDAAASTGQSRRGRLGDIAAVFRPTRGFLG